LQMISVPRPHLVDVSLRVALPGRPAYQYGERYEAEALNNAALTTGYRRISH
jgi:hypothetical protein